MTEVEHPEQQPRLTIRNGTNPPPLLPLQMHVPHAGCSFSSGERCLAARPQPFRAGGAGNLWPIRASGLPTAGSVVGARGSAPTGPTASWAPDVDISPATHFRQSPARRGRPQPCPLQPAFRWGSGGASPRASRSHSEQAGPQVHGPRRPQAVQPRQVLPGPPGGHPAPPRGPFSAAPPRTRNGLRGPPSTSFGLPRPTATAAKVDKPGPGRPNCAPPGA